MPVYQRDRFLDTVAKKLGRERRTTGVARPRWDYGPQYEVFKGYTSDELVEVLIKQCDVIHTRVEQVQSAKLADALMDILDSYHAKRVIVADDERFKRYGLNDLFDAQRNFGVEVRVWDVSDREKDVDFAKKADVGITFSEITLAESGTVVLFSEGGIGRSVSLLPRSYVSIIPKSTIVPRLTQGVDRIHERVEQGERIPRCINFISGPSNSADIEMNLVVGVHGPIQTAYIVVEDL